MPKRPTPETGRVDLQHDPLIDPSEIEAIFGDHSSESDNVSDHTLPVPEFDVDTYLDDSSDEEFDQVRFIDLYTTGINGICTCLPAQFYRCQIHDPEDELYGDPTTRAEAFRETFGSPLIRERFGHQDSERKLA